jgi:hypothetical protein
MCEGQLKAHARQMHITTREKMVGVDPIGFLCDVLSNENTPEHVRKEVAEATTCVLLRRFLCEEGVKAGP